MNENKYDKELDGKIRQSITNHINTFEEDYLSANASKDKDADRRKLENGKDIRTEYSRDADRILHTHAYARYIDKTQVFFLVDNDHITHRVLHVNFVSKIARTVGRALKLNEDLIEAIAIGHDIGHPPFGHQGENILDKICDSKNIGRFKHNLQAIQFLDKIEEENLTLQVLDGILSHEGEQVDKSLKPNPQKDWDRFDEEADRIRKKREIFEPMTMEGCVVRFADIIAYIARDIEDAKEIGLIGEQTKLPQICIDELGEDHNNIINSLIVDLIENSYGKDQISYSTKVYEALKELKKFNTENIYNNSKLLKDIEKIEKMYDELFTFFLEDLNNNNYKSKIYKHFIDFEWIGKTYNNDSSNEEKVRDFIAGMTDRYFIGTYEEMVLPINVKSFKDKEKGQNCFTQSIKSYSTFGHPSKCNLNKKKTNG